MPIVTLIVSVDEEALNESLLESVDDSELAAMSIEDKVQQEMGWLKGISVIEATKTEE